MIRGAVARLSRSVLTTSTTQPTLWTTRGYNHSTAAARANRKRRVELATAYRAMDHYGMQEAVDNHITALAPAADNSGREVMLLVPEGMHWSQVTPSCLMGLDEHDEVVEGSGVPDSTALCIHRGTRRRHNHQAVFHLHSTYTTALGCLEDQTLLPIHQTTTHYHGLIAYDNEFDGFGVTDDEAARLCEALGDKPLLMMGGHGFVACGSSVGLAFDRAYYLERCAMVQMVAMATGKPIREIPNDVMEKTAKWIAGCHDYYGRRHLNGFIQIYAKTCSEFQDYDVSLSQKNH